MSLSPASMPADTLIQTQHCYLRPLSVLDVGPVYASWFSEGKATFIETAQEMQQLDQLIDYVKVRENRPDVLFLGIFCAQSDQHIGNIKFEPINAEEGYAVLGVLIGNPNFRNQGIGQEIIPACCHYLYQERQLKKIYLGVNKSNLAAIRLYEKVGFTETPDRQIISAYSDNIVMVKVL